MLCYAWNVLEQSDQVLVGREKFDNIYNLFARIYINGVNNLIKRGLSRSYIWEHEEMSTLRGKVDFAESMKKQTFRHGRMICNYDNFSADMRLNQIIKTTIHLLLRAPFVDSILKQKLKKLSLYFTDIQEIDLSESAFKNLRLDRNNFHYKMLINISELIYKGLITREKGSSTTFADFLRGRQMANLYEKFVLNFYRKHLDRREYLVHTPKLQWNLDRDVNDEHFVLQRSVQAICIKF